MCMSTYTHIQHMQSGAVCKYVYFVRSAPYQTNIHADTDALEVADKSSTTVTS